MGLRLTKYVIKKYGQNLQTPCQQNTNLSSHHEKDLEYINRLKKIKVITTHKIPVTGAIKSNKQQTRKEMDCSPEKFAPNVFGCEHISEIFIKFRLNPDSWTPAKIGKELKISSTQANNLYRVLNRLGL